MLGPDSWNNGEEQSNSGDANDRKKKRRSRWNTDEDKIIIPGMPTVIPANLSESQQRQYVGMLSCSQIVLHFLIHFSNSFSCLIYFNFI